jgi:hypothetical protein
MRYTSGFKIAQVPVFPEPATGRIHPVIQVIQASSAHNGLHISAW